jgi:hypothetical protein
LEPETKPSSSSRSSVLLRRLRYVWASVFAFFSLLWSKLRTPKHSALTPVTTPIKLSKKAVPNKSGKKKSKQEKNRPHKVLTVWLLGVATIIGAAVVFLPRPTVTQGDPVDSQNPFSAPFTVANTGIITLAHVDIGFVVGQITTEPARLDPNWKTDWTNPEHRTLIRKPEWSNRRLGMDDRFTITPGDLFTLKLGDAEMAIVVDYDPWWIPWRREKVFRFNAHKQSNGLSYWYAVPLE